VPSLSANDPKEGEKFEDVRYTRIVLNVEKEDIWLKSVGPRTIRMKYQVQRKMLVKWRWITRSLNLMNTY
jgi:hypothetical protein